MTHTCGPHLQVSFLVKVFMNMKRNLQTIHVFSQNTRMCVGIPTSLRDSFGGSLSIFIGLFSYSCVCFGGFFQHTDVCRNTDIFAWLFWWVSFHIHRSLFIFMRMCAGIPTSLVHPLLICNPMKMKRDLPKETYKYEKRPMNIFWWVAFYIPRSLFIFMSLFWWVSLFS